MKTGERAVARWQVPLCIVLIGIASYTNGLFGAFVFDDTLHLLDNLPFRSLESSWHAIAGSARPLTTLSFALNYAVGGADVLGYHVVNIGLHVVAALFLWGILRRTFASPRLHRTYGRHAVWLAGAASLLWLVHPLQTESVTYIVQRAEILAGLCSLATLYSVIRAAASRHPHRWHAAAVYWCLCAMASKPVAVMAPVLVLLYDRMFLARSWTEVWRRRRGLYGGLAATWLVLATLIAAHPDPMVGPTVKGVAPLIYLWTQAGVIFHYLRLTIWPHPLVIDYGWPLASVSVATLPPVVALVFLGVMTVWALRRGRPAGYAGAWCLLTLAPTSSLIPIADVAFEHRMYLPLAAVVSFGVCATYHLGRRLIPARGPLRRRVAVVATVMSVSLFAGMTMLRNAAYRSAVALWSDVVARRPGNPRAYGNLGHALWMSGRMEEAITQYRAALRLWPGYSQAHYGLGSLLLASGDTEGALKEYAEALRFTPSYAPAHIDLAGLLNQRGRLEEARQHLNEAVRLAPASPTAHQDLAIILAGQGKAEAAEEHFRIAQQLRPRDPAIHYQLAVLLVHQRRLQEAIPHLAAACRWADEPEQMRQAVVTLLRATGQHDAVVEQLSREMASTSAPQGTQR